MAKISTFPYLFDEEKSISTSSLKKWGYFKNGNKSGVITWSRNGVKTGSINIEVKMNEPKIYFDYQFNNEPLKYSIPLISTPSNIGTGLIWYFLCPFTGKRCRKLHLINGKFMHRSNLPGGMYASQTRSKKWRQIENVYGCYFDNDNNYQKLHSKHFKRYYNGKPTKRYKKLMQEIKKAERFTAGEIEALFLMK